MIGIDYTQNVSDGSWVFGLIWVIVFIYLIIYSTKKIMDLMRFVV